MGFTRNILHLELFAVLVVLALIPASLPAASELPQCDSPQQTATASDDGDDQAEGEGEDDDEPDCD